MQVTKRKYQANGFLPFEKVVVCQSSSVSLSVTWGKRRFQREKPQIKLYKLKAIY